MGDLFQTEEKPITESDRIRLGGELAKVEIELKAKKDEKRKVNSNYRVAINKLEDACASLSTQLDGGRVQFKYAVEEVPDDENLEIVIVRTDTREQVRTRPMNEPEKEERRKRMQPDLFETHDVDASYGLGVEVRSRDTDRAPAAKRSQKKKAEGTSEKKKKNGKG